MNEVARGVGAVFERDARLFWSYRLRPFKEIIGSSFTVALFYELAQLVSNRRFPSHQAYFDYAVVGLALVPLLRAGIAAPVTSLREELIAGTFERFVLSPLGPTSCLLATLVFPFALAIFSGALILLVATALFGLHLAWQTAPLAIPLAALTAFALAPFAAVLLAVCVLVKQAGGGSAWILAGLSFVGGVYFPIALLPAWARWGADVQPLTPALSLLRHVLAGTPLTAAAAATAVTKLVLFGAVGLVAATALLRAACSLARKRGVLFDY